jgi:hypothetical protein
MTGVPDLPEEIKAVLDQIAEAHDGNLTARDVVAEAKKKGSPLHEYFTWNVQQAAQAHWEDQARRLIRQYRFVVTTTSYVVEVPKYLRNPAAAPEQGYVSVTKLRKDSDIAREVLLTEVSRAVSAMRRAKEVARALGMDAEIGELLDATETLRGRIATINDPAAASA